MTRPSGKLNTVKSQKENKFKKEETKEKSQKGIQKKKKQRKYQKKASYRYDAVLAPSPLCAARDAKSTSALSARATSSATKQHVSLM
jgi:hypothetical protein